MARHADGDLTCFCGLEAPTLRDLQLNDTVEIPIMYSMGSARVGACLRHD
jgi:hypothetical protein